MANSIRGDPESLREYKRLWMQQRRAAFFDGKKCVVCGSKKDLVVSFGTKWNRPARSKTIWSYSKENQEFFLSKARIVCDLHSNENKGVQAKHGTVTMYARRRCRCGPCRAANAAYQRFWRGLKARGLTISKRVSK